MNLDDCWIADNRSSTGELQADPTRFPHGMKWLADLAHQKKLKLGLYAAASIETCRNFPGSQGYEEVDAKTFASWGADFAKLDSCSPNFLANGTESWSEQYTRWSKAMNATGRQMVFSCSWAVYWTECAAKNLPKDWETQCGLPVALRSHHRLVPPVALRRRSQAVLGRRRVGIGDQPRAEPRRQGRRRRRPRVRLLHLRVQLACRQRARRLPRPRLPRRRVPDRPAVRRRQAAVPAAERRRADRSARGFGASSRAPLIIGSDLRNLSKTALATLSNKRAIAVNQDPAAYPPRLVAKVNGHNGAHQIWVRPMQNGDVAAALINTGSAAIDLTLELRGVLCVACGDAAMVDDLWGTDPPVLATGAYTAKGVRPHETVLLRLSLVK